MRPESLNFLFSPVTRIKGVGAQTAKSLANLLPQATALSGAGLPIIRDLLFHLPVSIIDRSFTCPLREAPEGVVGTFVVTVETHLPPANKRFSKKPYKVICSNETGEITLAFFGSRDDYIKNALPVGEKRVISGKIEKFDYQLQMTHPDIIAPLSQLAEVQKPEAVYPLTLGITSRRIAKMVEDTLEKLPALPEWISDDGLRIIDDEKIRKINSPESSSSAIRHPSSISWKQVLTIAHHPQTIDDLLPTNPARMRLAYDEMLANQLHMAILRSNMQAQASEVIKGTEELTSALEKSLPYKLTNGQKKVLEEIYADLESGKRMGRLLQGDVGSGKTIVALFAMLRAAEQGLQSALMVPTELIAQQHFEVISRMTDGGWRMTSDTNSSSVIRNPSSVILLTGSVKGAARKAAMDAISSGEAKIIIGTHALFQDKVEFKNLALVVVDEQHRFGVNQRMALSAKGNAPHILHMTATPIPRSLTMTIYGDMDCSMLKEKPAERLPITTRAIPDSRYDDVVARLKSAIDRGEKAYWICPLIEDSSDEFSDSDLAAAKTRYAEFKARFGNKVGLVHGRMKADERNLEMQRFAAGETKLLVATTVVEVGVDVRDATIMVVEKAERFGLAQLHQLRGRVGRGDKPSSCVLLYSGRDDGLRMTDDEKVSEGSPLQSSPSAIRHPSSEERLRVLCQTEDGFEIAEADLASRGGGDLLGTRQSGLPRFIFMDLLEHKELLERARAEVDNILGGDPDLKAPRGEALRILLQLFGYE